MGDAEALTWVRRSAYSITDGRNVVSKMLVDGMPGYLLWRWDEAQGRARLHPRDPCFQTPEAAIAALERVP